MAVTKYFYELTISSSPHVHAPFTTKTIMRDVLIALLPIIVGNVIGVTSLAIGGTSVIIVVGVAIETVSAIEAQMLMRHYKGFLE